MDTPNILLFFATTSSDQGIFVQKWYSHGYGNTTILSWIVAREVVDSQFSKFCSYMHQLSLEQMTADARVDIWRQVAQSANVNYTIILNPINVQVDVSYCWWWQA